MNRCFFIGNVVRDPELMATSTGINVCRFSIAVNRSTRSADGERGVDFLNIVAWRGLGEICAKYLVKGRKVCIVGELQTNTYTTEEGEKRYSFSILAQDVEFIASRVNEGNEESTEDTAPAKKPAAKKPAAKKETVQKFDTDDLPF